MGKSVKALITPEVLAWARASLGYSLEAAARQLKVDASQLTSWEKGGASPTVSQLRRIATKYRKPLAVFYLPEPPRGFTPPHDYRRVSIGLEFSDPLELTTQVHLAQQRRSVMLELSDELDEPVPRFEGRAHLRDKPEATGQRLRKIIGISTSRQFAWESDHEAFSWWKGAIESTGVLVFQFTGVPISEARAFSISEFPFPAISLNTGDYYLPRIFSLLHELAHLLLRKSGLCDISDAYDRMEAEESVEVFCNHVAAAALMPPDEFLAEFENSKRREPGMPGDYYAPMLARKFKVSREAALRRLLAFGHVSRELYVERREQYIKEYRRRSDKRKKKGGFLAPALGSLVRCGDAYVNLVLTGYQQRRIPLSRVSDYLDVRTHQIPKVGSLATARAVRQRGRP
ncbi:ImmA/IrrE family metallo-endopeptidase [Elusimicrobiota bacterium]